VRNDKIVGILEEKKKKRQEKLRIPKKLGILKLMRNIKETHAQRINKFSKN
jgi:hypothetical protein